MKLYDYNVPYEALGVGVCVGVLGGRGFARCSRATCTSVTNSRPAAVHIDGLNLNDHPITGSHN